MSIYKNISIIVPVYNEEKALEDTLIDLLNFRGKNNEIEIILINDGSKDGTREIIEKYRDIILVNHPYNKGYGASIKTGMKISKREWILWFDSDGQHSTKEIKKLLPYLGQYDMIVGQRDGYKGPIERQPGKRLLHLMANYLSGHKIPDINSGFRLVKRNEAMRFIGIYPNAFSISTTITLAFFREGLSVKYVPFKLNKRIGKSTVNLRDGFKTILLIIRMAMLFSPLKIFLPLSAILSIMFIISLVNDITKLNVGDTTVLLLISSILILFFGLLADQISSIRRNMKN